MLTNDEKMHRFKRALSMAGNTHDVSDVLDRIGQQKAVCWTNGDSVVVTEVIVSPRVRALNYWLVCGDLHECAALQPAIDAWGLSEGCSIATAIGRMGWLRLSRTSLGSDWKPQGVKFVRELTL